MRPRTLLLRTIATVASATVLLAIAAGPAVAATMRSGDRVTIDDGETLRDDLYATGGNITIRGTVDGDVYAAGTAIVVEGRVNGNLVAVGSNVTVRGEVSGTVLAAGTDIDVLGRVGKDVVASGSDLRLGTSAEVGRDVYTGGTRVELGGRVGRDVRSAGTRLVLGATVGRNVFVEASQLRVTQDADIEGDLVYRGTNASISPQATVAGETRRLPARRMRGDDPLAAVAFALFALMRMLIGYALFAAVVAVLFPHFLRNAAHRFRTRPGASLGLGVLALIALPFIAIVLTVIGIFVGGWWIGLMLLALWWIAFTVAFVVAATALGSWILERSGRRMHPVWPALLGVLLLVLLSAVPVIGWLAVFAATLLGLGALLLAITSSAAGVPGHDPGWL